MMERPKHRDETNSERWRSEWKEEVGEERNSLKRLNK